MKAFWASLILFVTMLTGIVWNAVYIHRSTDRLRQLTDQLEDTATRQTVLAELDSFWEAQRIAIGLSVSFRDINRVSESIDCLLLAHSTGNDLDFQKQRILLDNAISEIERADILSVDSLF